MKYTAMKTLSQRSRKKTTTHTLPVAVRDKYVLRSAWYAVLVCHTTDFESHFLCRVFISVFVLVTSDTFDLLICSFCSLVLFSFFFFFFSSRRRHTRS